MTGQSNLVADDERGLYRVTRTYLSLPSAADLVRAPGNALRAELIPLAPGDVAQWRMLYHVIGAPYHWHDRDAWSDETLREHLRSPRVRAFSLYVALPAATVLDGGFLELQHHDDDRVEIVYLGLDQRLHGRGIGRWLLEQAVDEAARMTSGEIWLHTCTLDGPSALPNYLARGFRETRVEQYDIRM